MNSALHNWYDWQVAMTLLFIISFVIAHHVMIIMITYFGYYYYNIIISCVHIDR